MSDNIWQRFVSVLRDEIAKTRATQAVQTLHSVLTAARLAAEDAEREEQPCHKCLHVCGSITFQHDSHVCPECEWQAAHSDAGQSGGKR